MRICSLLPSATEIVADLGLVDSLVAVSEGSSHCSPSRDVCYGVFNRGDKVVRGITRAARRFGRPTLCARLLGRGGAEHTLRRGSFPVFRHGGSTLGSSVNYARRGRYRVTWRPSSGPLGASLYFRLPLSR